MKKAILFVSFGTTFHNTRRKNIDAIAEVIDGIYSDYTLYQAFTSSIVRKKLAEKGVHVASLEEAFEQMKADGIEVVAIQPSHVISGIEYDKIADAVSRFENDFVKVGLGKVLLSAKADYEKVVDALVSVCGTLEKDTAVLWMGHGSAHQSGEAYSIMQNTFATKGYDNHFMGTVEGLPCFEDAVKLIHAREKARGKQYAKIILRPFMLVAGDHANNDMAGEEDSWKTALEKQGYAVEAFCVGLGEYAGIKELYLEHLGELIKEVIH